MSNLLQTAYDELLQERALQRDPEQEAVLDAFERLRDALAGPTRGRGWFGRRAVPVRGIYLWGGVGRGKSMLMDLFVDKLGDIPARRVHFHAFMQDVHAGLHKARQAGAEDAIAPVAEEIAKGLRLLALDEMQISDITDAMIVGRLFEALFSAGVAVVTTSNRPPEDLYKHGLNRALFLPFIDLIRAHMEVLELAGDQDHRRNRLSGEAVYYSPADAEARAAIDRVWQDLTGGRAQPLVLTVQGREVEIPAFHYGAARARFYDLCGRPLGPADYLALAEAVQVLVLEDIPQMGRANFNEARRFVTLIDALYEARVRLIASAAAPPEMLYLEGEGSFEFARTVSRLQEMQGADWGQSPNGDRS